MGAIGAAVFTGSGSVILKLMFLAIGAWLAEYIASAIGKGQVATLIKVGTLLIGFAMVIGCLADALAALGRALGL